MVIRSGAGKAASVILVYFAALLSGIFTGLLIDVGAGYLLTGTLLLLGIYALTRFFRGGNESDEPREWWRMTAYPLAGYVLAVWFAAQAVSMALVPPVSSLSMAGTAIMLVIAIGYVNSSAKLSARQRASS
ncbi:hypothetical protein [Luethyella okanaganae]|uniref:Uncharacterized protein n=1 Tax=Luethyella okanaganae TaxID=69372 RepID=A0ABW1VFJ0_9MICO